MKKKKKLTYKEAKKFHKMLAEARERMIDRYVLEIFNVAVKTYYVNAIAKKKHGTHTKR